MRVEGVTLTNPASWTCYFKECDGVLARKVTIFSHANYNNDGFDIDSKNVLIEDCTVDSDDDAICPKSDNPNFVPENIEVRNCRLASNCNFIKFGTSSRGGFRNWPAGPICASGSIGCPVSRIPSRGLPALRLKWWTAA